MTTFFKQLLFLVLSTLLLLSIPLMAMPFVSGMNWDATDFIIMGGLIFGTGLIFLLAKAQVRSTRGQFILGVVLLFAFLLVWADLAVGIFNIPGFSGN